MSRILDLMRGLTGDVSTSDVTTTNTPASTDSSKKLVNTEWAKLGFAVSLASNGYIKLPTWLSGLIIQWGNGVTAPTGVGTATFAIPFPNACLTGGAFDLEDSAGNVCYAGIKWTTTTLTATFAKNGIAADAVTWTWFAIGH